jgi:putative aminopeptidase FrvX
MSDRTKHFELMRELMEIPGPTGREQRVMSWLRDRWSGKAQRVWTAKGGNLFAHVGGTGPRLLVEGHADEIGFVVRSIDPQGFIWLGSGQVPRSDISKRYPIGQPALIVGRDSLTEGIFASTTGHILSERQRRKEQLDYYDLFVDIGASSREDVLERGIHPGLGVIWNPTTRRIGDRVIGKAVDDRFALAIMTLLLDKLDPAQLPYDLYFAATTQEEIGLVGAASLRSEVDADLAIALDNGPVGDIPTVDRRDLPTRLGAGPALVHKDGRAHYSEEISWQLAKVAERNGIPIQHAVWEFFGSDGDSLIQQGIPTALIGLSTRYTHSPFEMFDLRDFDLALDLVRAFVTTAPSSF